MVKILRQKDKTFQKNFNILLKKRGVSDLSIENAVDKIIKDVQTKGDLEVLRLSNKFDKIKAKTFLVTTGKGGKEIKNIYEDFKNRFSVCNSLKEFALEIQENYCKS